MGGEEGNKNFEECLMTRLGKARARERERESGEGWAGGIRLICSKLRLSV